MPDEMSVRELRAQLADVLHNAAILGRTTVITSRGRRIAVVAPLPPELAEDSERPSSD